MAIIIPAYYQWVKDGVVSMINDDELMPFGIETRQGTFLAVLERVRILQRMQRCYYGFRRFVFFVEHQQHL